MSTPLTPSFYKMLNVFIWDVDPDLTGFNLGSEGTMIRESGSSVSI